MMADKTKRIESTAWVKQQPEQLYQQLVQQEPTEMDYYQCLVKIYHSQDRVAPVIALYQSFIQFNPTSYLGYHRLGDFYKDLDRYDEAISSYQQAIQVDAGR